MSAWWKYKLGLLALASGLTPNRLAFAQAPPDEQPAPAPAPPAPEPTEPPAPPAEAPPAPAPPAPAAPAAPPPTAAQPERFPTVFPAPKPLPPPARKRAKPLRTTVGLPPTAADFGAEADIVAPTSKDPANLLTRKWQATIRAFLRAPARVGIGPRNDGTDGNELHSPPRMVGLRPTEWTYINIAPPPTASLYLTVENNKVSGNVIITTDTFYDAGYDNLEKIGGVAQAYVTLKFAEVFGQSGGLAWTVGGFSNRYGLSGPEGKSTGFYGTYLFGRTHTAGSLLTANIDLSSDLELVLEHGFGAKIEVVPFDTPGVSAGRPPTAPYLPYQGPAAQGSNFVNHAHAALFVGDSLKLGAHYLSSWTPNDFAVPGAQADEARMNIVGGDIHLDGPKIGNAYLGYSYIQASDILPLSNGVEVIHSPNGYYFKQNYFGPLDPNFGDPGVQPPLPSNDSGTVHTVLGQYILRLAPLLGGDSETGPDVALGVFGMLNHIETHNLKQDRFKFGGEIEFSPINFLSIGTRFDRVLPDGENTRTAYSALSPRVILHSHWLSREYIILSYTRFFLGPDAIPSEIQETPIPMPPFRDPNSERLQDADPNLIYLAAVVSF